MVAFSLPIRVKRAAKPPRRASEPVRLGAMLWRCLGCGSVFAADKPRECGMCGSERAECLVD